jgi:hypothetical protein
MGIMEGWDTTGPAVTTVGMTITWVTATAGNLTDVSITLHNFQTVLVNANWSKASLLTHGAGM